MNPREGHGWGVDPQDGMSPRDYFAGLAMHAIVLLPNNSNTYAKDAEESYKMADAMLAERAKKKEAPGV